MKCDVDTMEGSGGEGGRSARETHTDAPTPAGGYTYERHTYAPKERAHLFLRESREKMQSNRLCKIILVPLSIVSH